MPAAHRSRPTRLGTAAYGGIDHAYSGAHVVLRIIDRCCLQRRLGDPGGRSGGRRCTHRGELSASCCGGKRGASAVAGCLTLRSRSTGRGGPGGHDAVGRPDGAMARRLRCGDPRRGRGAAAGRDFDVLNLAEIVAADVVAPFCGARASDHGPVTTSPPSVCQAEIPPAKSYAWVNPCSAMMDSAWPDLLPERQ